MQAFTFGQCVIVFFFTLFCVIVAFFQGVLTEKKLSDKAYWKQVEERKARRLANKSTAEDLEEEENEKENDYD